MKPLSRRISLSPFPTLRHHSGTVSGPSITFHQAPSLPAHSIPYSVHSVNIPVLHYCFQHHRFSPLFSFSLCTPVLSLFLRFYPYPLSVCHSPFLPVPRFYPFILCFCLAVSWTKLLSNITINRRIVLSHFAIHLRFLSIYKPVY